MIPAATRAAENSFHATDRPPGSGRRRGHRDPRVARLARLRAADRAAAARVARNPQRARRCTPAGAASSCRSPPTRPTSTPSPSTSSRPFPATARSSAASRASSAGTRWRWWSGPTRRATASAATSPPTPRRRRCTRSASTTSSAAGRRRRRRLDLLPGPRLARHVRPRLPRRPARRAAARELPPRAEPGGGLSSYPHPWLMPDFWQFPTVSMGLGPIMAIYQARFNRYLEDRGLKDTHASRTSGLPGRRRERRARVARRDHAGLAREARQPDLRHQLQPAAARRPGARQRQDHPGAGSALPRRRLERHQGHLGQRLGSAARARQRRPAASSAWAKSSTASTRSTSVEPGAYIREHFFGKYPRAARSWSSTCSDEQLQEAARGGHDPGEGLRRLQGRRRAQGPADGHPRQDDQGLRPGRGRRGPQHHPPAEEAQRRGAARVPHPLRHPDLRRATSPRRRSTGRPTTARRSKYLRERREALGGYVPSRQVKRRAAASAEFGDLFEEFVKGTGEPQRRRRRWSSSACWPSCCSDKEIGK